MEPDLKTPADGSLAASLWLVGMQRVTRRGKNSRRITPPNYLGIFTGLMHSQAGGRAPDWRSAFGGLAFLFFNRCKFLELVWCQFRCGFSQLRAVCDFRLLTDFQAVAIPRNSVQEWAKGF